MTTMSVALRSVPGTGAAAGWAIKGAIATSMVSNSILRGLPVRVAAA